MERSKRSKKLRLEISRHCLFMGGGGWLVLTHIPLGRKLLQQSMRQVHQEQEVQEPGLLPRVHIILLDKKLNLQDCPFNKKAPRGAGGTGAGPPSPGSYHPSEQETELQGLSL